MSETYPSPMKYFASSRFPSAQLAISGVLKYLSRRSTSAPD